jgi:PRTRC genetic system protein C
MQEIQITRSFRYNSITLPDPNPALGPEQVREFYASQYPELNNAVVEGPLTRNAVATYTFTRAAGAKGCTRNARSAREIVQETLLNEASADGQAQLEVALQQGSDPRSACIAEVALRTGGSSTELPIPSAAFGIWG